MTTIRINLNNGNHLERKGGERYWWVVNSQGERMDVLRSAAQALVECAFNEGEARAHLAQQRLDQLQARLLFLEGQAQQDGRAHALAAETVHQLESALKMRRNEVEGLREACRDGSRVIRNYRILAACALLAGALVGWWLA